jgi:hypothetical protein
MSLENIMSTLTAAMNSDRIDMGRFQLGNKGGPGNPFAGTVALLRKAVLEYLTPADIQGVVKKLVEMAKEGHWQAAKLILSYALGKQPPLPCNEGEHEAEFKDVTKSPNGVLQEAPSPNGVLQEAPSPNGVLQEAPSPNGSLQEAPSPNGEIARTTPSPNGDFAPLFNRKQRRAQRKAERLAKRKRHNPVTLTQAVAVS